MTSIIQPVSINELTSGKDFPAFDSNVLGMLNSLELSYALRVPGSTFKPNNRERINDLCVKIDGYFPEILWHKQVRAIFWVYDSRDPETQKNYRQFLLKIEFNQSLKALVSGLTGREFLDDHIFPDIPEIRHALTPEWDYALPEIYYSSVEHPEMKSIANFDAPYQIPAGLSCRLAMATLFQNLLPDFDLHKKVIKTILLNLEPGIGNPKFNFLFNFEVDEGYKQHNLTLRFDQLKFCFAYSQSRFSFRKLGVSGHIDCAFHQGKLLSFEGDLDFQSPSLTVRIADFPDMAEIFESFLPKTDPFLHILHETGLGSIAVDHLQFQLDLGDMSFNWAEIKLSSSNTIDLAKLLNTNGPSLKLKPDVLVRITDPFKRSQKIAFEIKGYAEIAGTCLDAYYSSDMGLLSMELSIGTPVNSKSFNEALPILQESMAGIEGGNDDHQLSFSDISLQVWKTKHWNFELQLDIQNDWKFDISGYEFGFSDLFLQMSCIEEKLELELDGSFLLGGVNLEARAAYSTDFGWVLTGKTAPFSLDISDLIKKLNLAPLSNIGTDGAGELADHFGFKLKIEQLFLKAELPKDELSSSFSKELEFMLLIGLENEVFLPIPLDFFFLKICWKSSLTWEAALYFTIKPRSLGPNDIVIPSTQLVLESKKENNILSFHGELDNLKIGDLINFFKDCFNVQYEAPAALADTILEKLDVSLVKAGEKWTFTFECDTKIPLGEGNNSIKAKLVFKIEKEDRKYTIDLHANAAIKVKTPKSPHSKELVEKEENITFNFRHKNDENFLLGTFAGDVQVDVLTLLKEWLNIKEDLPLTEIRLKALCIALQSRKERTGPTETVKRKFLFGITLDATMDLDSIAFLKQILPEHTQAGVNDLRFAFSNAVWTQEELKTFANQFDEPSTLSLPKPAQQDADIGKGVNISGTVVLGEFKEDFLLGSEKKKLPQTIPAASLRAGNDDESPPALTKWFPVNKTLGPLHIARVGIQFQYTASKLFILLDAGLELAVLTASLDGFGIGSSLSDFKPELQLAGLGFDFKNGPLEIGGALLVQKKDPLALSGMLALRYDKLNLSVLGSYRQDSHNHAAVLLYGHLDYPIGGPPFFFVEGLAAGAGIHRKIEFPAIDKLAEFPLIKTVIGHETQTPDAGIAALEEAIPVQKDHYFFAAGVKFNTFKMIDAFVLLILSLGEQVQLDLLGYAVLTAPRPAGKQADPVAQARLLLHASFKPAAGTLQVEARLDPDHSYLLSKQCRLQGGFAFYAWFDNYQPTDTDSPQPGDFVLTLGGYHPQYNPRSAAHLPKVPRVGFLWNIDAHMHLKGELYFALTPAHLMAGGMLEATWKDDHLEASFLLAMHVLMAWQPFHYEGTFLLTVRAGYHDGLLQADAELGTEIQVWGPEFGGEARFKIALIEVTVAFGAPRERKPKALDWKDFSATLLPGHDRLIAARITKGMLTDSPGDGLLGSVDPAACELVIETQVPVTKTTINNKPDIKSKVPSFGIPAMGIKQAACEVTLTIVRANGAMEELVDDLEAEPVLKNGPAALWGTTAAPQLNSDAIVQDLLFGYRLKPSSAKHEFGEPGLEQEMTADIKNETSKPVHTPAKDPELMWGHAGDNKDLAAINNILTAYAE